MGLQGKEGFHLRLRHLLVWWCCWSEPALALRVEQADHFCLRSMQPYCWLGSTSLY